MRALPLSISSILLQCEQYDPVLLFECKDIQTYQQLHMQPEMAV